MVVRVNVVDAEPADALIRRLVEEVHAEQVCFDSARQQVCIDVAKNPDEGLVRILNVVEEWLGVTGCAPTTVEIDERSYVLEGRTSPERAWGDADRPGGDQGRPSWSTA